MGEAVDEEASRFRSRELAFDWTRGVIIGGRPLNRFFEQEITFWVTNPLGQEFLVKCDLVLVRLTTSDTKRGERVDTYRLTLWSPTFYGIRDRKEISAVRNRSYAYAGTSFTGASTK
ncbi:MAG: hypothetical protein V1798_09580 [Pseudomonadota bacterium]